ncbi:MAG: rod shape-determining protein MreD [Pseudomonadota bacterium]|uniref:rod shape-determining protein MreD n=1 Tax=Alcanivorax sp. TaxID=1872427 RepID=UPI002439826B|nr:rod shape-determining protein MreD [Alcanivorax sp.]MEE3321728.1 rod shape-determining protein MreD [Pseudomonadota bacterium]
MRDDRPAGTGVLIVTLLLAALLEVVPLPDAANWVRPEWMLLVLVYWVLILPRRVGVLWGFFVGLYMDVLTGTTLGQWGLGFSLGAFIMLLAYKRMRVFTVLQQCAVIFLLVGSVSLLAYLVQEAVGRTLYPPYTILYSSLASAIVWRPVCALLRWVQLRFIVR